MRSTKALAVDMSAEREPVYRVSPLYWVEPRFERIRGRIYNMASPSFMHQWASANLVPQLNAQLLPFGCFAIAAPFDVYLLYDQGDEDTFVQPDVSVLCNRSKLQPNRYNGAPRFLIEILSSDRRHDMELKRELYLQAGVEEYWIIDPEEKTLTALTHSRGMYLPRYFGPEEEAPLSCIPGCKVDLRSVLTLPWEKQGEYGVNG